MEARWNSLLKGYTIQGENLFIFSKDGQHWESPVTKEKVNISSITKVVWFVGGEFDGETWEWRK